MTAPTEPPPDPGDEDTDTEVEEPAAGGEPEPGSCDTDTTAEDGAAVGETTDAPASPDGGDAASSAVTSGRARLRPGELRTMVLEHLRAHRGTEFSPHQLGRALGGRSAGAVANALATLTADGEVVETSEKPRKYALTSE